MQLENAATFRSQLHYPHVEYEERVFTFIFICVLLLGIFWAQYFQSIRIQRAFHIPKPEAKKVAEIIIKALESLELAFPEVTEAKHRELADARHLLEE